MSNMGKGAGYYLTRSKSLLIDTAIVAILAIFMSFAMQMDALQSKGEDYLVLMLYAVIFGLTSLQSGAMIVDLTAKDKLSKRDYKTVFDTDFPIFWYYPVLCFYELLLLYRLDNELWADRMRLS